ncbi:MAG: hypothetical protein ACK52W_02480 [Alphaproteobacteria bacterium]
MTNKRKYPCQIAGKDSVEDVTCWRPVNVVSNDSWQQRKETKNNPHF